MATDDITITAVYGPKAKPLPLAGSTLGSTNQLNVKKERHDEHEIQKLAAKMVETQKKKAAQIRSIFSRNLHSPLANGQANIVNYLTRANGTTVSTNAQTNPSAKTPPPMNDSANFESKEKPCDEESQKGHFGWTTFGETYIPYIYRQAEKYCAVRILESKLLRKYLNCLHPDIYNSCTCVRSYYITNAESRLFNEINHKHCDGEFGSDLFTLKDLVVRLSDAIKFYQFLDICYQKLISEGKTHSEKCGFICINKESVVSYTVCNNEKVVPLFYFEGKTENLKQKADYLTGWDLAYLKFCCKVHEIRKELFSSQSVAVISLTDIKSYFPSGMEFEDYWPSKVVNSNLLLESQGSSEANNSGNWTRQPLGPPQNIYPPAVVTKQRSPQHPQRQQEKQQPGKQQPDQEPQQQLQSKQVATKRGVAFSQMAGYPANKARPQSSTDGNNSANWTGQPLGTPPNTQQQAQRQQQQQQQSKQVADKRGAAADYPANKARPQRLSDTNNSLNWTHQPLGPPPNKIAPAINTGERSQQQLQLQQQQQQQQQPEQQKQQLQSKQVADMHGAAFSPMGGYPANKARPQRSSDTNNSLNWTHQPLGPPPNKIAPAINTGERSQQQLQLQQQQQQQLQSKQVADMHGAAFSPMGGYPANKARPQRSSDTNNSLNWTHQPLGPPPNKIAPAINTGERSQQQLQLQQQQQQQLQSKQVADMHGAAFSPMGGYPANKARPQRSSDTNNSVNWTHQPLGPQPNKIPPAINTEKWSQQQLQRQQQQQQHPEQQQQSQQQQQLQSSQVAAKRVATFSQIANYSAIKAQRLHANYLVAATQAQNGAFMEQSQNSLSIMHPQLFPTQAQRQNHPSARPNYLVPNHYRMLPNIMPDTNNIGVVPLDPVNNHSQRNGPPPSYMQEYHQFCSATLPSVNNSGGVYTRNGTGIAEQRAALAKAFTAAVYNA